MKAIILAAGYATRLYPLTLDQPKPLLPVNSKPMINYIIEKLIDLPDLTQIFVVSNDRFYPQFLDWAKNHACSSMIQVVNDQTKTLDDRLGAIRDIQYVLKSAAIDEDCLVIAGDNLFEDSLVGLQTLGTQKNEAVVGVYDLHDLTLAKEYGLVSLGEGDKIDCFVEKGHEPISSIVATCVYFFPKESLSLLDQYIGRGENLDAPGNFVQWLVQEKDVYGYRLQGYWYDIGSKQSYQEVNRKEIL